MFKFLCKKLLPVRNFVGDSTTGLYFLQIPSSSLKPLSSKSSTDEHHSFTLSYLINSCGLSPESALSASKKVHFETPEKPDSVLTLFRNHGFNETQISKLVRKLPHLLLSNPEKILLPKLEFLNSIGVSSPDLATILSSDPKILTRSLENQIIPSFNFLKSVVHVEEKVVTAFKRTTWVFLQNVQTHMAPNVAVLRELGVPQSNMSLLLTSYPALITQNPVRFIGIVKEIKEMGFNPSKSAFVLAMAVFSRANKSTRDRRFGIYRMWGWSEEEIFSAFRQQPHCMLLSDEKLMRGMDYLVNKMGYESAYIARRAQILLFSLEKRIIPRCSVLQVLISKGLIKKDFNLSTVLKPSEKYFLNRFVTKYQVEVPQLLNVYQGKMDIVELGFRSEEIGEMKQL